MGLDRCSVACSLAMIGVWVASTMVAAVGGCAPATMPSMPTSTTALMKSGARPASPSRDTYVALADETEAALRRHILGVWFPRCVDAVHGGFHADFDREWRPIEKGDGKFSIFQGRMTWVAATVALRRPELREQFLPYAKHGVAYLTDAMWDKQLGGFYLGLDNDGRVTPTFTDGKHLYGISFCLYGLAAAYEATQEPTTLALAQRTFHWIDEHAHDAANGGYFEWLTRDGRVPQLKVGTPLPGVGFPAGRKSMNTHIHLLESFAALYKVWPDPTLRARLDELRHVVRDRITNDAGAMPLYFTDDWKPADDRDSYGHDVETAYLLLEATDVLGIKDDTATGRVARRMVDHALAHGWDAEHGGFYREGVMRGAADLTMKDWWVQVEGLHALLMMHARYGTETNVYFERYMQQWRFILGHQIDAEHDGLWETVAADGKVITATKSQNWKAAYHDGRALMEVTDELRRLGGR